MSKHCSPQARHLCVGSQARPPTHRIQGFSAHPLGVDRPCPTEQLRAGSVLLTTFILTGVSGHRADDKLGCRGNWGWQEVREGLQFGEAGSSRVYDAGDREGVAHAPS